MIAYLTFKKYQLIVVKLSTKTLPISIDDLGGGLVWRHPSGALPNTFGAYGRHNCQLKNGATTAKTPPVTRMTNSINNTRLRLAVTCIRNENVVCILKATPPMGKLFLQFYFAYVFS